MSNRRGTKTRQVQFWHFVFEGWLGWSNAGFALVLVSAGIIFTIFDWTADRASDARASD